MAYPTLHPLVRLFEHKLAERLFITADAPAGFVRMRDYEREIEINVVREDEFGKFRVISALSRVSRSDLALEADDDLGFDGLFQHLWEKIEDQWTLVPA